MVQLVRSTLLIIIFSATTVCQLSEAQCTRGTLKGVGSGNCTKCPENTFMDVDNHTHTECKKCRTTLENHEGNIDVRRECNATHDLFLNCSQNHFVQVEDRRQNVVECSECRVCSNGEKFEILPCNDINDTFCCASADMVAEPNKDGLYECASRPSTTSSTTITTTVDGATTSNNGYATHVTSQTSNQYELNITSSSDNSGRNELDSAPIAAIVVSIVFVIAVIVIIIVVCHLGRNKTARENLAGCCKTLTSCCRPKVQPGNKHEMKELNKGKH
ncbi:unnamed protein product [Lymnaea stagnalis]|uniref:TNFR-Cys domain-containing protein n=1 Tax=Lymnaea stagnalis TaxID=6523 RepID=A0AAV2HFZ9_LYMST